MGDFHKLPEVTCFQASSSHSSLGSFSTKTSLSTKIDTLAPALSSPSSSFVSLSRDFKIPYMLILGDKEQEAGNVGVRSRKDGDIGQMSLEDFISKVINEIDNYTI